MQSNEKYGYNYKTYSQDFLKKRIHLPEELVAKKSCLKKVGEISLLEGIPQRLISKYEEMFMLENKDVIINHGKEITLSKELINLRNSSSLNIITPNFSALSNFDPGLAPAIT